MKIINHKINNENKGLKFYNPFSITSRLYVLQSFVKSMVVYDCKEWKKRLNICYIVSPTPLRPLKSVKEEWKNIRKKAQVCLDQSNRIWNSQIERVVKRTGYFDGGYTFYLGEKGASLPFTPSFRFSRRH